MPAETLTPRISSGGLRPPDLRLLRARDVVQIPRDEGVFLGAGARAARVLDVSSPVLAGSDQRRREFQAWITGERRQAGFHVLPTVAISEEIAKRGHAILIARHAANLRDLAERFRDV